MLLFTILSWFLFLFLRKKSFLYVLLDPFTLMSWLFSVFYGRQFLWFNHFTTAQKGHCFARQERPTLNAYFHTINWKNNALFYIFFYILSYFIHPVIPCPKDWLQALILIEIKKNVSYSTKTDASLFNKNNIKA